MMDDRFEDVLREAARDYNPPPATPREEIWARIETTRRQRALQREKLRTLYSPWFRWSVGIAAALLLGVAIGRLTSDGGGDQIVPVATRSQETGPGSGVGEGPVPVTDVEPGEQRSDLAYRLVAAEHLSRAETLLTLFRTAREGDAVDPDFWSSSRDLLTSTRLLLDSPVADDPLMGSLLEELELVLVQIVQLADGPGVEGKDREMVNDGIQRRGLLPRLRTAIPTGPAAGVEGVL